jgi:hypothetical protein
VVVRREARVLSACQKNQDDSTSIVDRKVDLFWVITSESSVQALHSGIVMGEFSLTRGVDVVSPFESMDRPVDRARTFAKVNQVTPQSSMEVRVVTNVLETPMVRVERPGFSGVLLEALDLDTWRVKTLNEDAGPPKFLLAMLEPVLVCEVVAWSSRAPEMDPETVRQGLLERFSNCFSVA